MRSATGAPVSCRRRPTDAAAFGTAGGSGRDRVEALKRLKRVGDGERFGAEVEAVLPVGLATEPDGEVGAGEVARLQVGANQVAAARARPERDSRRVGQGAIGSRLSSASNGSGMGSDSAPRSRPFSQ